MREITETKEIQEIAYQLLDKFDRFCETHGLSYILAGGTLLGAVRHKGFIPWDDDLDVQMPRPDYEKFIQLAHDGVGENTRVISRHSDPSLYFAYAKIIDTRTVLTEDLNVKGEIGVFIDIFPADGLPDDETELREHFDEVQRIKKRISWSIIKIHKGKSLLATIGKIVILPFARIVINLPRELNKLENETRKYPYEESKKIAFQVLGYGYKEITTKKQFTERIKCRFERREYYIPAGYDEYLRQLYGDYLELPPVDQRVYPHNYSAYWRD